MKQKNLHSPNFLREQSTSRTVILISVDSLRADRVTCERMPEVFNRLRTGYYFERAYANTPYTGAAHSTMLTSLYACNHGKTDNSSMLPRHITSIADVLETRDINTNAVVSAAPLRSEQSGFDRGFSTYVQDDRDRNRLKWFWIRLSSHLLRRGAPDIGLTKPYMPAGEVLEQALNLVQQHKREQQFFLFVHLMDLHEPFSIFDVERSTFSLLQAAQTLHRVYTGKPLSEGDMQMFRDIYDANVAKLDRLLSTFVREVLDDQTTIIITSDHGENAFQKRSRETGERYPGKNRTLYDAETHVPLIVLNTSIDGPVSVENAVSHVDVAPTILELFRVPGHESFQGQAFWDRDVDSPIYMERLDWFSRKEACWFEWPWKLITVPGPEGRDGEHNTPDFTVELYNLEHDSDETVNLYDRKSTISATLLEQMITFIDRQTAYYRECHQETRVDDNSDVRERLRMLGYLE